jgi:uncharacterized membrane protein YjgN (DUF898 family)
MEPTPPAGEAGSALPPAAPTEHRMIFSGSGGEYFRIWIVNLLLTIVTLGIYGAWAKVRRLRYFYGHTTLAGSSFEYHAQPKQILIGRLIALGLILPYYLLQFWRPLWSLAFLALFLVALPFIIVRSQRFHLRMSSWRNVRFNYAGTYGAAAAAYLGWGLLTVISIGLLGPYADLQRQRLKIAYSRFGGVPFVYGARPGRFYVAYLVALGVGLLAIVAFALLLGGLMLVLALVGVGHGGKSAGLAAYLHQVFSGSGGMGRKLGAAAAVASFYLAYFVALFLPYAIIRARTTNESLNTTTLRAHRLRSTLASLPLWGILVSNLLLVVLTLGLFAPWAHVRMVRYQLQHTSLLASGSLDDFVNEPQVPTGAAAQEFSDFMDLDFGL